FKENKSLKKKEKSTISEKIIGLVKNNKKKLIGLVLGSFGIGTILYRRYYRNKIGNNKTEKKINEIEDDEIPIYLEKDCEKLKSGTTSAKEFQDKIRNYYIERIGKIKNKKFKCMSREMVMEIEEISKMAKNIKELEYPILYIDRLDKRVKNFHLLFDIRNINTYKVRNFLKENSLKENELEVTDNLKKLLDENEDININLLRFCEYGSYFISDQDDKTALMIRAVYQNYALAKALIEIAKIDPNLKNYQGRTALMEIALETDYTDETKKVVDLLTKLSNIDVNAIDVDGKTALMYAAQYSCKEIVQSILNVDKVEINKQDYQFNDTALFYVRSNRDEKASKEIFETLLEQKGKDEVADITIKNKFDETVLHSVLPCYEHVSMLLKQTKINEIINQPDEYGNTPLISAVLSDNYEDIVELLVGKDGKNAGIDVNLPNKNNGKTPLMSAVEKNNKRMVQALLNAGASKDEKDHLGNTALNYATTEEIRNLLSLDLK
ncbi:MAG: ankyrin repeat domain-containing protein, partial [Firmicutes bacterium]|nr:ankyrin repeat domain-containing protein [Bacillota bacterium]